MFANLGLFCTFAVFKPKNTLINLLIVGAFFYANTVSANAEIIQGYQIPLTDCSTSRFSNCSLARTGGDNPFHISILENNFFRNMPKNKEITSNTKYSSVVRTPYRATTVIPRRKSANLYLSALIKSFNEFLEEERHGNEFSHNRLLSKIEASRLLYPDYKKLLKQIK